MIFVGADTERGREIWFDDTKEVFLSKQNDETTLMGKVNNFVYPIVPRPQNMNSPLARRVTLFATRWIHDRKAT